MTPAIEEPTDLKLKLIASVDATRQVWTVGDLIAALNAHCAPSERLTSLEFGVVNGGQRRLVVERDEHGRVEVRERV
jgi:hypothetical protein